jgi:hypothetical protein
MPHSIGYLTRCICIYPNIGRLFFKQHQWKTSLQRTKKTTITTWNAQGVPPHILANETLRGLSKNHLTYLPNLEQITLMLTPHFITSEKTIWNSSKLEYFLILTRHLPQSTFP